jgi:hypothetical protein
MVGSRGIRFGKLLQQFYAPYYFYWSCHGSVVYDSYLAGKPLTDAKAARLFLVAPLVLAVLTSQIILGLALGVEIAAEAIESQSFSILKDADGDVLSCPAKQLPDESLCSGSSQVGSILETMMPYLPMSFQIFLGCQASV